MSEARAKWRELICEQSQSGQSVSAFCRERDLRVWQFYEWKKRVRDSEPEQFVGNCQDWRHRRERAHRLLF
ncbi:MAG TPA: hypothetical protein VK638_46060 [Edaphobacter sp.]|nr:hypothetical protein [Edaphobacter sp.]